MECSDNRCQGRDFDQEVSMIEKYGYYVHMVPYEPETQLANYHSHGLSLIGHPDMQVVIALPAEITGYLFKTYYDMVKSGTKIQTNKLYEDFLQGYAVQFIWAVEQDRDVLRMILPDKSGNTQKDSMDSAYKNQWDHSFETPQKGILKNGDY